jgi:hypothetical protein
MKTMAKRDAAVDFTPFEDSEQFYRWVSTNHGTNVTETCKNWIRDQAYPGTTVKALNVVSELTRSTRQVDFARNGFRARFGF